MNISGITQRLGEILLRKDDTQEIDFITWTATAVMHCTSLEEDIYTLREKYEEQIHVIEKLNQQLEELINAKIEHESLLLEKFRDLLNAKKLKIRDQQRLLASTNVNPNKGKRIRIIQSRRFVSLTSTFLKSYNPPTLGAHQVRDVLQKACQNAKQVALHPLMLLNQMMTEHLKMFPLITKARFLQRLRLSALIFLKRKTRMRTITIMTITWTLYQLPNPLKDLLSENPAECL